MLQALKEMSGSKKAIVFVVTVAFMAAVIFGGVETQAANDFTEKLYLLAMAYLGGQGLADLGRYAGEAYRSGKVALETRDIGKPTSEDVTERVGELFREMDPEVISRIARVMSEAEASWETGGEGEYHDPGEESKEESEEKKDS